MKTLLERGLAMLADSAPKAAGGSVIYTDGSSEVWIDRATFGQTLFETANSDSTVVEFTSFDLIVPSDDLILNGKRETPQRGHRFTRVMDDQRDNEVYEVLAPNGQKVYRLCDPEGILIRIHSKKVSA